MDQIGPVVIGEYQYGPVVFVGAVGMILVALVFTIAVLATTEAGGVSDLRSGELGRDRGNQVRHRHSARPRGIRRVRNSWMSRGARC